MKIYRSLRSTFLATLLATTTIGSALGEGNPDFVGILASITDPANAADLGLSQNQVERLVSLIKQHESKALDFASQLRNLPSAERRKKERESVREIETKGYELLSEQQRATAEKWRLQKLGPMALLDSETASQLGVTPEQVSKFDNILEGRSALARSMGSREKAVEEIQKRLVEVLTDEQKNKWVALVGTPMVKDQSSVNVAASPSDAKAVASGADAAVPSVAELRMRARTQPSGSQASGSQDGLLLNFNATPWPEVLKWLAREADLSLQMDYLPTGTFTYSDSKRYTVAEAMDIMNGILLTKGYTLIKKQRILTTLDLESGETPEVMRRRIADMAELVSFSELDRRGEYELVKCLFSLERTSIEDMEKEVGKLLGPQGSVIPMASAQQLLITETGGKLRIIRDTIERSENPQGSRSAKIVRLPLKYVSAEEVMGVARNLLKIKENEFVADDISISTDTFGSTLFATGTVDKLQKLQDIVAELDKKPDESGTKASAEQPYIKSHSILGSDPTTTEAVLQSAFAGQPNINMAVDPKTNNIIFRGTKADHDFLDKIISELAGQTSDVEFIPLGNSDPQIVLQTLERLYGKIAKDKDPATIKGPIYSLDPTSNRMMVKGTTQEVEQIKILIGKLEESSPIADSFGDGMRMLPMKGKAAERVLEQVQMMIEARKSRIKVVMPKKADEPATKEAGSKEESKATTSPKQPVKENNPIGAVSRPSEVLTAAYYQEAQPESGNGEVRIFQGPTGLVIASDDPEAMREFDMMLREAQKQMAQAPSEPTIRYLEHISAAAAAELVKSVIAGEQATGGGGGGLLGDVASSVLGGGGMFGSLFGGGGGSSGSASSGVSGASTVGSVVLTPDARLNALWVQANPIDAMFVEDLLSAIDIPESPAEIRTRGDTRLIFVKNNPVADIETVVKSTFAAYIGGGAAGGAGGAPGAQRQPSPEEFINAMRGAIGGGRRGGGAGGSAQSELKEQTMTISSDKKNNVLIVVGPKRLHDDVKELVDLLDQAAEEDEQTISTIQLDGSVNPTLIQNTIANVFGPSVKTSSASTPQTNTNQTNRTTNTNSPFDPNSFRNRTGGANPFGGFGGGANPFGGGGFNPFGGGGGNFGRQGGMGTGGGNPFGGGNTGRGQGGGTRGTGGTGGTGGTRGTRGNR
ncbi:MAG: secretin N-terminal domain-containing protein [Pirellula sp.]